PSSQRTQTLFLRNEAVFAMPLFGLSTVQRPSAQSMSPELSKKIYTSSLVKILL
ncbi:hypothetical protein M406DRAFT_58002, partial [Cryphonectria parasitica EP155]